MEFYNDNWVAPETAIVPDFIICGAMKSGTSTLHRALGMHPGIYIPDGELGFFDIDDIYQHYTYNCFDGEQWFSQVLEDDPLAFWAWYTDFFKGVAEGQIIGEDSTTYFASERAIERIAKQNKNVKLVVMLRHPTDRAYSQYWHMVRSGLLDCSFEDAIRFEPSSVLDRSMYDRQLARALRHIPRSNLKILVFEEYLQTPGKVLGEVCDFLGVAGTELPPEAQLVHENHTKYPQYIRLRLLSNRLLRARRYSDLRGLPLDAVGCRRSGGILRWLDALHRRINPNVEGRKPPMHPATREFLDKYFARELAELDRLAEQRILHYWFGTAGAETGSFKR